MSVPRHIAAAVALTFAVSKCIAKGEPFCDEQCADGEAYEDIFGSGRCVTLLPLGAPCELLNGGSTAMCDRGSFCNRGACSKAIKGDLCSDDPSVCADGLTCDSVASLGDMRSLLHICKQFDVPEGGRCTAPIVSSFQYQREETDRCATGLFCVRGRCAAAQAVDPPGGRAAAGDACSTWQDCSYGAPYCVVKPSSGQMVCMNAQSRMEGRCDLEANLACAPDAVVEDSLKSRLLSRVVEGKCEEGVCVSATPDYPYAVKCSDSSDCDGGLVCGEGGRCISASKLQLRDFRAAQNLGAGEACEGECKYGFLCVDKICKPYSDFEGVSPDRPCGDGQKCMEPLTCKDLVFRRDPSSDLNFVNLRCSQESLQPGSYCTQIPDPKNWRKLDWLQCAPGSECTWLEQLSFLPKVERCIQYVNDGEVCGFDNGLVCKDDGRCVFGTCE